LHLFSIRQGITNSGYSLKEWFGENARQDADYIYLSKSDLAAYGLVPTELNSLIEIMVALKGLWSENQRQFPISFQYYRTIIVHEEGISFLKECHLIKCLSRYNNSSTFPSPSDFK
jgi:hypothetical protein